ncbi:MAG TPA: FecR domain-containing protein [Pseudoxanthomonas sp.]|jgi:transmembrane sensor|nr:FecR domain-containing protein [Pseudoxanthomonas sp.]
MEERETSQDIDRIAAQWVARRDRLPASARDDEALEQWLAGDRRRRGAYLRAQALWLRSEAAQALGPTFDPAEFRAEPRPLPLAKSAAPARRWMSWGGALAASLLMAVSLFASLQMPTAYATAKGEMRTVPLGDGTTVTLNTDSRIQVYEDADRRRIRVVQGEVLVESTPASRPTSIEVEGGSLRASTATFLVRKLARQPTQVLVQRGRVMLASNSHAPLPLRSNTGASLAAESTSDWRLAPLPSGQLARDLAWREGNIALQGETLAQAAAIYARYSDRTIVIADAELAKQPVTGLFAANNPLGFAEAVAEVFDADVDQDGKRIVLTRAH